MKLSNRGITFVILMFWIALVAVSCEEHPCDVEGELRCHENNLEHCVDHEWELLMDCKVLGPYGMCRDAVGDKPAGCYDYE